MTTPSAIATAAETIDGLTSLDLPRRGAIPALHAEARRLVGEPLALAAAREVLARTSEGGVVAILTGFPEFPWIGRGVAETDGPIGAAVLARALIRACRAIPILPCEPHFAPMIMAALRGIGLTPVLAAGVEVKTLQLGDPVCLVEATDEPVHASRWLATRAPALVVAIERPGQAATGVYHSTSARSVPFSTRPSPDHSRVTQPRPHEARSARQGGACRRGRGSAPAASPARLN